MRAAARSGHDVAIDSRTTAMQDDKQKDDTRRFYALLGVPVSATAEELRERYRSMLVHARAGIASGHTDALKLQQLREAYLALTRPAQPQAA
jgi:curved DNA-binding protein CbpA